MKYIMGYILVDVSHKPEKHMHTAVVIWNILYMSII